MQIKFLEWKVSLKVLKNTLLLAWDFKITCEYKMFNEAVRVLIESITKDVMKIGAAFLTVK